MIAKRKLTRSGIQYFDAGGNVLAPGGALPLPTPNGGIAGNLSNSGPASWLTSQNGYEAQLAPVQQSNFQPLIQQASGNALAGNNQFQNNLGLENGLATALINQGNGIGPDPAAAQLAQATGANVANQGALLAGQRGASSNVGLMARQIAMQQAATQQQAAGQAATLEAQQQLAARNAAAGLLGTTGNQIVGEQNANTGLLNTGASAQTGQNNTNVANYGSAQGLNQKTASGNAENVNKTEGGILGGIGSGIEGLIGLAKGGTVPNPKVAAVAPQKRFSGAVPEHVAHIAKLYHPHMFFSGGPIDGDAYAAAGKMVPGKAEVKGDSPKNDKVVGILSPKEIILPRSVTMSDDAPQKAYDFVAHLKAKYDEDGEGDEHEDFKTALKKAMTSRRSH